MAAKTDEGKSGSGSPQVTDPRLDERLVNITTTPREIMLFFFCGIMITGLMILAFGYVLTMNQKPLNTIGTWNDYRQDGYLPAAVGIEPGQPGKPAAESKRRRQG